MEWITITPQEMKRIETAAMGRGLCTGEELMNRAAAAVCGTGNNGGDAMAALRILLSRRADLTGVCLVLEGTLTPDARRELDRLSACPEVEIRRVEGTELPWEQILPEADRVDCIIDGLFGTGLCRPVGGIPAALCRNMNRAEGCPIVAVDIPSGLCGRTGQVLGEGVTATETAATPAMQVRKKLSTFPLGAPGLENLPSVLAGLDSALGSAGAAGAVPSRTLHSSSSFWILLSLIVLQLLSDSSGRPAGSADPPDRRTPARICPFVYH